MELIGVTGLRGDFRNIEVGKDKKFLGFLHAETDLIFQRAYAEGFMKEPVKARRGDRTHGGKLLNSYAFIVMTVYISYCRTQSLRKKHKFSGVIGIGSGILKNKRKCLVKKHFPGNSLLKQRKFFIIFQLNNPFQKSPERRAC